MLEERQLDCCIQLTRVARLYHVTGRIGNARAIQKFVIDVGCQEDDRNMVGIADLVGGVHATDFSFKHNVHQHNIGGQRLGLGNCVFAGAGNAGDRIAKALQHIAESHRGQCIIFNN